jgi:hypothetical protein
MRLDTRDIAEEERCVEACLGNARMEREQSFGAIRLHFGGSVNELLDGGIQRERQFLDALDERIPRWKAQLTRDHGLGVVERDGRDERFIIDAARIGGQAAETREGVGVPDLGGAQQVFRLALELPEVRALG